MKYIRWCKIVVAAVVGLAVSATIASAEPEVALPRSEVAELLGHRDRADRLQALVEAQAALLATKDAVIAAKDELLVLKDQTIAEKERQRQLAAEDATNQRSRVDVVRAEERRKVREARVIGGAAVGFTMGCAAAPPIGCVVGPLVGGTVGFVSSLLEK